MKSRSDESWRERNPVERKADVPEVTVWEMEEVNFVNFILGGKIKRT